MHFRALQKLIKKYELNWGSSLCYGMHNYKGVPTPTGTGGNKFEKNSIAIWQNDNGE